ncbi:MAG: LamG domain-containing protein, partial [Anaerolineae bacterium]|nr:LamG domain-containing protein [Anaerolineae bacterium]
TSLRRVWSMAIYQGRLFAGTLPSGRVYSIEAGKLVSWDRAFPAGWHHLAAIKQHDVLQLYVDGQLVASAAGFQPGGYNLNNEQPLRVGFGAYDYFNGHMSDLRLYRRALTAAEIAQLAAA